MALYFVAFVKATKTCVLLVIDFEGDNSTAQMSAADLLESLRVGEPVLQFCARLLSLLPPARRLSVAVRRTNRRCPCS